MPFCPKCKYEYREGITRCPDCDLPLKAHLREEPEPEPMEDEWVDLGSVSDVTEANVVKGVLEASGIPVWLKSDASVSSLPVLQRVGPISEVVICVPESRVEEANKVLREASSK